MKLLNKIKSELMRLDDGLKYKYGVTRVAMGIHRHLTVGMFE